MTDPRYQGGSPVFKDDPRMPVQTVLDNLEDGMTPDEIAKAWKIELRLVTGVRQFAESHKLARPVR
jgi:uncharacterized protein (DUF433 family)